MKKSKSIAVVGVSARPNRPSYEVAEYLIDVGYEVFLVNPRETEILGRRVYDSVSSLPKKVDIVDIFRRASDVPPVVEDAIRAEAGAIWMQLDIVNEAAANEAALAGLAVVMDRCTKIEHKKIVDAEQPE
ncbi:MAG: CoA-binding protein [Chloroflexi bacterium]|nr:CoA-binding protein [Chloroflexota bacterium]|tara:strand:- start:7719 stop:8108 length:390 start_codon:yes stop_codon:yes gene_type:complete